jgi:hypothetical protein
MIRFLVGYEHGNIYCIYYPRINEVKVSQDVMFSENEFFNVRHVNRGTTAEIIEMESEILNGKSDSESDGRSERSEIPDGKSDGGSKALNPPLSTS